MQEIFLSTINTAYFSQYYTHYFYIPMKDICTRRIDICFIFFRFFLNMSALFKLGCFYKFLSRSTSYTSNIRPFFRFFNIYFLIFITCIILVILILFHQFYNCSHVPDLFFLIPVEIRLVCLKIYFQVLSKLCFQNSPIMNCS